jgi:subtilisin family serine protease
VPTYTIGGTVSGLTGTGLVLRNNGGNNLAIAANGSFTFTTPIASGATYSVAVLTHPTGPNQNCVVANGSGTVGSANVTNVSVTCTNSFSIGGTVSGLVGVGMVLQNNGGDNLSISANGAFTFATTLPASATYLVTVSTQPTAPSQTCTVSNGSGTVSANVTNITVTCPAPLTFSIGTVNDPLATQQWHLLNTGQNAYADGVGVAGMDINVNPVYSTLGIAGAGVIAAVVDTGLEIAHEDLTTNVVVGGSWNFLNSTTDPTNTVDTTGDHGTSVGGLIAMALNNSMGGIGVAPNAKLKGFNFLQPGAQSQQNFVDSLGGSAASPNSMDVFVFNQSFGVSPTQDILVDPADEALYLSGVTSLRSGRGALYVKAAGNGFNGGCGATGVTCENASFDPSNTLPYQIVVGAVNADGIKSSYSTAGSAIWVSAPGGEFGQNNAVSGNTGVAVEPAMVTTDQSGCTVGYSRTTANTSLFNNGGAPNTNCRYTNTMNGTSSATPVTAGVIALLLEANPLLTWRDVKHILALTARQIDAGRPAVTFALSNGSYVAEPAWTTNAAGRRFHNWYGLGMVDASAAVNMARNSYALLGPMSNTGFIASPALAIAIPDNSVTGASHSLNVPSTPGVQVIEAVQIRVSLTHTFTGDLGIELTSPSGTRSVLLNALNGFGSSNDLSNMVLLSNAFYGENPTGTWTIKVVDAFAADTGTLTSWAIRVYGR